MQKTATFFAKKYCIAFFFHKKVGFLFFFFFRFFSWFSFKNIWRSIKLLNPKLCLYTKYGHTQSTKKSPKTLYLSFQEEETQVSPYLNPAQTALFFMSGIQKNSKPIIGPFTPFGSTAFFIRTFAEASLKCFAFQTWKNCFYNGFNPALKKQPETQKWLTKSNPPGNWSKKLKNRQQLLKNCATH